MAGYQHHWRITNEELFKTKKVLRMEVLVLYFSQNNVKDLRHTQKLTYDTSQLYFWYNFNAVGTICAEEINVMGMA